MGTQGVRLVEDTADWAREACAAAGQPLTLRRHPGYDHGYYFISTFVEEHLRLHRRQLG